MFFFKYRCISWDERGFGGSVAKENFTYWDSAQDSISLLEYLNINNAVFFISYSVSLLIGLLPVFLFL